MSTRLARVVAGVVLFAICALLLLFLALRACATLVGRVRAGRRRPAVPPAEAPPFVAPGPA